MMRPAVVTMLMTMTTMTVAVAVALGSRQIDQFPYSTMVMMFTLLASVMELWYEGPGRRRWCLLMVVVAMVMTAWG